jgi:predicted RNA-binding Zn-ribbon protein involved in translation (DUF1610 family)
MSRNRQTGARPDKDVPLRMKVIFLIMVILVMSSGAVIYVDTPIFFYGAMAMSVLIVLVIIYFMIHIFQEKKELFSDTDEYQQSDESIGLQRVFEAEQNLKRNKKSKKKIPDRRNMQMKLKKSKPVSNLEKKIETEYKGIPNKLHVHVPKGRNDKSIGDRPEVEPRVLTEDMPEKDSKDKTKQKSEKIADDGSILKSQQKKQKRKTKEKLKPEENKDKDKDIDIDIDKDEDMEKSKDEDIDKGHRIGTMSLEESMYKKRHKLSTDKSDKRPKQKGEKVTTFLCPSCGSKELYYEAGLISGYKYHCKDCDYIGSFVIEKDFEV